MFDICGRRFSVKTVAMLAKQMVWEGNGLFLTATQNGLYYSLYSLTGCRRFMKRIWFTETLSPTIFWLASREPRWPTRYLSLTLVWPSFTAIQRRSSIFHTVNGKVCRELHDIWVSTRILAEVDSAWKYPFKAIYQRCVLFFRAITSWWPWSAWPCVYVLFARLTSVARLEGGYEQAKVREDWWKEANHSYKGPLREFPW